MFVKHLRVVLNPVAHRFCLTAHVCTNTLFVTGKSGHSYEASGIYMVRRCVLFGFATLIFITLSACTSEGSWDIIRRQQELVSRNLIWLQRIPLTLNNDSADELTDFPVLVLLDASQIDMSVFAPEGRDIRFHAEPIHDRLPHEMDPLPHEVEYWNPAGVSAVWVRVPRIPADSSDTRIWMYFDNPTAIDRQRPQEVWSNGYAAVWHLNEDGPPYRDSGPNELHGTSNVGGYSAPVRSQGHLYGHAQDFAQGSKSAIVVRDDPAIQDLGPFTISYITRVESIPIVGARILNKSTLQLWVSPGDAPAYEVNFTSDNLFQSFANPWIVNSWTQFSLGWSGQPSPIDVKLFRNGLPFDTVFNSTPPSGERVSDQAADLIIGNVTFDQETYRPFGGQISSVMISSVVRSPGWIQTTHRAMFNEGVVEFGVPEAVEYQ